jgi:uncharacterized membrane protein
MNKILNFCILIIISFILLIIGDFIWFQFSLKSIYEPMFYNIQNKSLKFRYWAGIIVWLLLAIFITIHTLNLYKYITLKQSFWIGFFSGFIIYGVYNFTNLATFENYSLITSILDTLWGAILIGIVSLFLFLIQSKVIMKNSIIIKLDN